MLVVYPPYVSACWGPSPGPMWRLNGYLQCPWPGPGGCLIQPLGFKICVADIKKAYRKLAIKHHPDKGGDPEKFKEISRA